MEGLKLTKKEFKEFKKLHKIKLNKNQPFHDYHDTYINKYGDVFLFYANYFEEENNKTHIKFINIKTEKNIFKSQINKIKFLLKINTINN